MRLRPAPVLASGLLAAALLLSGCGVSTATFRPGVAAEVGDTSVSVRTVDDAVGPTCRALQSNPQLIGSGFTGEQLRGIVLAQLVLRDVADQLAADNGLDARQIYTQNAEATRGSLTGVPDDVLDQALPVFTASTYLTDVVDRIVTAKLGANTDSQVRSAAAQQLIANFQQKVGIETNPLFAPLDFTSPTGSGTPPELSVAVSGLATAAAAPSPDPQAIAALPANQRCAPDPAAGAASAPAPSSSPAP